MNDIMGPDGMVPSYLVFGVLRRYPSLNCKLPLQVERMRMIKEAESERGTIVAEARIIQVLRSISPAAASVVHAPGTW